ncbi:PREDICTED: PTI1-like tyrosine-protein kinase At3g15890 [Populus euphratica]|uniref:PTI1-like tyrosine-protein kinase At3g15890 n=1 Tax=Populus euphratica TaxID=75702 RepID=A0AAJ6TFJ6_POPEU|nr:PREDICTED: PTI1-like tyrosine-protein kinase At3g15890 [Populus euphratica]
MAFTSMLCCVKKLDRKERGKKQLTWRIFSLKELHSATNNFNYDNKLGEGGFGSVYWGQLWDGSQIAVKRLKVWSNKGDMEFAVEVEILARVRHKNLLSLRGYCAEGQERLIVYDYMPNLSLLSHLHGHHSAECLLDWKRRMNIAIGSAAGITYLHHHATPHIIHRDIKASNVLLDSDFQAQVADFGFAKLIPDGATHVTTRVKGTLGYLAPEYAMLGKASESCDVYSFGILLLELATGKRPLEKMSPTVKRTITDWALPLACERKFSELADPKLNGKYDEEELKRVVLVSLVCAHTQPERRPTMLDVVELLKGESKEKLSKLENDEMFKAPQAADFDDEERSIAENSSEFISEEKDVNREVKEIVQENAHNS